MDLYNKSVVDGSIVVVGVGEVQAMPDKLILEYSVDSNGMDAQSVSAVIDEAVIKFFNELKNLHLDEHASAEGIVIEPVFSDSNRKGPRRLIGYQGSRHIRVTLRDFAQISRLNELALECGMTKIVSHDYKVSDRRKYEDEATHIAAESVKHQAELLAHEFGLDISKPSTLRLYNEQDINPYARPRAAMFAAASCDNHDKSEEDEVLKPEPIHIRSRIEATYDYQH